MDYSKDATKRANAKWFTFHPFSDGRAKLQCLKLDFLGHVSIDLPRHHHKRVIFALAHESDREAHESLERV